jgi:hypothetical protein
MIKLITVIVMFSLASCVCAKGTRSETPRSIKSHKEVVSKELTSVKKEVKAEDKEQKMLDNLYKFK